MLRAGVDGPVTGAEEEEEPLGPISADDRTRIAAPALAPLWADGVLGDRRAARSGAGACGLRRAPMGACVQGALPGRRGVVRSRRPTCARWRGRHSSSPGSTTSPRRWSEPTTRTCPRAMRPRRCGARSGWGSCTAHGVTSARPWGGPSARLVCSATATGVERGYSDPARVGDERDGRWLARRARPRRRRGRDRRAVRRRRPHDVRPPLARAGARSHEASHGGLRAARRGDGRRSRRASSRRSSPASCTAA